MLNSLIFKHYDFAAMEKVRENALISLFWASFYCGKEAKTLAKTSFRVVFSGRECYFLHLALFRSRAFLDDYCTSGRCVVFTSRIYGGRLSAKHRCSKVTEILQQPSKFSLLRLPSKTRFSIKFQSLLLVLPPCFHRLFAA